jgi:hypothetical protein
MELKIEEKVALINIGLGTWKEQATRHFGLSHEQYEETMYLYYESQRARVPREPKCQRQFPLKMSLELVILRVMGECRNCLLISSE